MPSFDLSLDEISKTLGGQLLSYGKFKNFSEITYDSRKATPQSIFWCIPGKKVDGHDFISAAVNQGSIFVIGQNKEKLSSFVNSFPHVGFLWVDDILHALQALATFYRKKFHIPVAAIAGASGKTTTKDLVGSILNHTQDALVTEGTFNNHWGVPQMVLRLRSYHKVAVFELGMNHFGEIANLSNICQPQIGVITNVGKEHLEALKNEEGSFMANRELFEWIFKNVKNPTLIFNLDDLYLSKAYHEYFSKMKNVKCLSFSSQNESSDMHLVSKKALGFEHRFGWEYEFNSSWGKMKGILPLPGDHNLANAMCAATVALATGMVTVNEVEQGLRLAQVSDRRSHLFKLNSGALVYNDSYNANPTSFTALFETAKDLRGHPGAHITKVIALVGDMLELGENSPQYHEQMGVLASKTGVDLLFSVGKFSEDWVRGFTSNHQSKQVAQAVSNQTKMLETLRRELKKNPEQILILVKGSRGAKMDEIVSKLH